MSARVLITHASMQTAAALEGALAEAGCEIFRADNIEAACHLLHQHPDLLLLDMGLTQSVPPEQLSSLAEQLEFSETFCLRLGTTDLSHSDMRRLAPFACGTICAPGSSEQILEQLAILMRIKQTENERNRAQELLMLHQMEVAEGLRSASQIQSSLLPTKTTSCPSIDCAWQFIPCETVGGDLFNIIPLSEDVLMLYMLDVSGHGVPSAMVTVSVHQSLSDRTGQLVKQPLDHPPYYRIVPPAEVLTALDQEYPYERFEKFFTISYLLLEPATGRLRYSNGGHPPPLLIHEDGSTQSLETGGTLVGMGGLLPYEEEELLLRPGDRLYLYSDGITEHENESGEMYGEQRLCDFFCRHRSSSLQNGAEAFCDALQEFAAGKPPADDISLLCIQFNEAEQTGNESRS